MRAIFWGQNVSSVFDPTDVRIKNHLLKLCKLSEFLLRKHGEPYYQSGTYGGCMETVRGVRERVILCMEILW